MFFQTQVNYLPDRVTGIACGVLVMVAALFTVSTQAVETKTQDLPANIIRLNETVVSGNQELPKVLYIVPWQQPDGLPEIALEPELSELQVFRRLYPPAYRRELKYYELLKAASTEK